MTQTSPIVAVKLGRFFIAALALAGLSAGRASAASSFTFDEALAIHKQYLQETASQMRSATLSGRSMDYYFTSIYLMGMLSAVEVTQDESDLVQAMSYIDNMISKAITYRGHKSWGPGTPDSVYVFQGCQSIARAAYLIMKIPAFKAKYASRAQGYINFVDDAIVQNYWYGEYRQNPPWLTGDPLDWGSGGQFNDKSWMLSDMANSLYMATGKEIYQTILTKTAQGFRSVLRTNGNGYVWNMGVIPIGSDDDGQANSIGNQSGWPDTDHTNRVPLEVINQYESGQGGWSAGDVGRFCAQVGDTMWNQSTTNPMFSNYINGSNVPYRNHYKAGENGFVFAGWALCGRYNDKALTGVTSILKAVRNGPRNISVAENSDSYYKLVGLSGQIVRVLGAGRSTPTTPTPTPTPTTPQPTAPAPEPTTPAAPTTPGSGLFKAYSYSELLAIHKEYVATYTSQMESDANSGDSSRLYFLSYDVQGILSAAEATKDPAWLAKALHYIDVAIAKSVTVSQPDSHGAVRSHRVWGPLDAKGLPNETYNYQMAAAVARAAALIAKYPAFKEAYGSKAQEYVNFVNDSVLQYWIADKYDGYLPWVNENPARWNWKTWSDKASHIGIIALSLWQATQDTSYQDLAVRVGNGFKARLQTSGGGWVWDNGAIPIGSDTNGEAGSVGNQAGVPDTAHANREPMMVVLMHEAGLVFSKDDVNRMTRTVTDTIWRGTVNAPLYSNYINGSNAPYRTRKDAGSNGFVYLGWAFVGRYSNNAQNGFMSVVYSVRKGMDNPTLAANRSSYGLIALTGHLLRNASGAPPVIKSLVTKPIMPVTASIQADTQDATTVHWQAVRVSAPAARVPNAGRSMAAASLLNAPKEMISALSTAESQVSFQDLHLAPGHYTIVAQAENSKGELSAPAQAEVTLVQANFDETRVFPNPWRVDQHDGKEVTFDHLPVNTEIRIFTVAGHWVKTLTASINNAVTWDLKNDSGDNVASGLYLYVIKAQDQQIRGKLAVIR